MEQKVSIIIPITREEKVKDCLKAIKENAGSVEYEIISKVDKSKTSVLKKVIPLIKKAKYDLILFLGDDSVPLPGFLEESVKVMNTFEGGWGVVGLRTEQGNGWMDYGHVLVHKKMLEFTGGESFASTEYYHCFSDDELHDIAEEMNRFKVAKKAKVLHDHPINCKGDKDDEFLKLSYSDEVYTKDKKTYYRRKRARMQKKYGVRLAVAVPLTDETVYRHFFFSFIKVITEYMSSLVHAGKSISIDVLMPDFPCQIDAARNNLVSQALEIGCTHILMMDSDQIYMTENMIEKMMAHEKPVVGARVHRRYPPFDPLLLDGELGKLTQIKDDRIKNEDGTFKSEVQVEYTGTGCILYDMSIFNDMIPERWFEFKSDSEGRPIGEDIWFCEKLKKRGIPVIVDASLDIKHLTLMAADWGTYKIFQKLIK